MYRFFISLLPLFLFSLVAGFNVDGNDIVDEYGRQRVFHGVNVVYKSAPYIPMTHRFDANLSFVREDAELLHTMGLNIIRLGVMWAGVEPIQGRYDETYIDKLQTIVRTCADYNISVLLDAHQDIFSERFCGEGVPLWAAANDTWFPAPLHWPYALDPDHHLPLPELCERLPWVDYHFTHATAAAYETLYTTELADAFAEFWAYLADVFHGAPNILGFELLNEPFAGDVYLHPSLMLPSFADDTRLLPFYDRVVERIRQKDPDRIVFFEPVTWSDAPFLPAGFHRSPEKPAVFAYHYYDNINPGGRKYLERRRGDAGDLGVPSFCTEMKMGREGETLDWFGDIGASWILWTFKSFLPLSRQTALVPTCTGCSSELYPNGILDRNAMKLMTRSYALAVQGHTLTTTKTKITYWANASIPAPTLLFLGADPIIDTRVHHSTAWTQKNYFEIQAWSSGSITVYFR